jgi:hypothetical protein
MSPDEFQVHIFEGVFGTFEAEGKERRVDAVLTHLVGRSVQLAAHHLPTPPTPKDPNQWLNIVAAGTLTHDPESGRFTVTQFDGTAVDVDLMAFCGCAARVLVATTDAIEHARDVVMQTGAMDNVEGLGKQADKLRSLMDDLVKIAGDQKQ